MNDAQDNLNPIIFYVPDSTVIFCKLQLARNGHAPQHLATKLNALNVNFLKLLASAFQNN